MKLALAYLAGLAVACLFVGRFFSLGTPASKVILGSVWSGGKLVARAQVGAIGEKPPELERAMGESPAPELVYETVTGDSRVLSRPEWLFSLSLVPGLDGVMAEFRGQTAYVTPDDLLSRQAYDHAVNLESVGFMAGADIPLVRALLAERLHARTTEVEEHATIRRFRVVRTTPAHPPAPRTTGENLTHAMVRDAALDAARHLARGVSDEGRFRYLINATDNRSLPGYDYPRHAGATYFLAQAAALSGDPELRYATLRAAGYLRDRGLATCGEHRCITGDDVAEIGSSALGVIAFVEIVRTGIDQSYRPLISELTRFLRSQQRPDGEFMHQYDRSARRPIDVQFLYFTGEATLALARAHTLDENRADLEAAERALAHLVGPAWSFFGDRYYFGEEHWTCQAMADLARAAKGAPSVASGAAFDFCLRWQRFGRSLQHTDGDSPQDADGSLGMDPVITPRLTPVASRCEAAVATLDAATRADISEAERRALDHQTRRALAFILRHQFRPGPVHLFADPAAVHGAIPGSPVDFQLRIDYAQHAGSAMIRWLEVAPPP